MVTVLDMMKLFERLDLPSVAAESVQETQVDFLEQQRRQLFAGKDSEGNSITPFYRPATISRKKKKGQPFDRVTLKDKGDFYNSLYLELKGVGFDIKSSDPKAKWLIRRYGDVILGLGGGFRMVYVEDLKPTLFMKMRKKLGL